MHIIPDDELCIQQMLGIVDIPEDIQREYLIRTRMLHRQLAGGPIGPIAIVDMLRFLDYALPPPQVMNEDGRADWRRVEDGTPVEIRVDGKWFGENITYAGEVGGGTLAVNNNGRIDEFNAFDVRIPSAELPSDVDAESFEGEADRPEPDARINLIGSEDDAETVRSAPDGEIEPVEDEDAPEENEVAKPEPKGDIGTDDDVPANVEQKVNWGTVKKGTEVWFRDGDDMHEAAFHHCVPPGKAKIQVQGEQETREVERAFLKMP
jgi:hypothetical protein